MELNPTQTSPVLPSNEELEFIRKHLPKQPGCYLFKNHSNEVLYVGKAKSLFHRVNSYWQDRSSTEDPYYSDKIQRLVKETRNIEVFIVENELEALILENELIKEYQPPYNVRLKDAKSYPWVQITKEKFPRIRIIRMPEQHGLQHKYIGPFVDGKDLKHMLRFLRKIFPYCTCKRCVEKNSRTRPCVYHQINLCPAPCVGKITPQEYQKNIINIEKLLLGYIEPVKVELEMRMEEASNSLKFEEAALWRDRINALDIFTVDQSILAYNTDTVPNIEGISDVEIDHPKESERPPNSEKNMIGIDMPKTPLWSDMDVIAGHFSEKRIGILIIHVRRGRVLNKTPYIVKLKNQITSQSHYFAAFVKQHYLKPHISIPPLIVLGAIIPKNEKQALLAYFEEQQKKVAFQTPNELDKSAGLMRIAAKNITLLIRQKDEYEEHLLEKGLSSLADNENLNLAGLAQLQELLELESLPIVIEGFDMSHNQGQNYVGSKVTLRQGVPDKSQYRRYKIRDPTIDASNDIGAMREVLTRRYKRMLKDEEEFPDLIVVDGGIAQLNMTHDLLVELGLEDIPHIGLAKPPGRSEVYQQPKIVRVNNQKEINLEKGSAPLRILQLLRDESHRFAINYHRTLQKKQSSKSILDKIPGIGPKRKQKLLSYFKSIKRIRDASEEEITSVVGPHFGKKIIDFLHHHPNEELNQNQSPKKMKLKKKNK